MSGAFASNAVASGPRGRRSWRLCRGAVLWITSTGLAPDSARFRYVSWCATDGGSRRPARALHPRAGPGRWAERRRPARFTVPPAFHDTYVPADRLLTTSLLAEVALRIAPPGAVAARHTAAVLWGGVVPDTAQIHLTLKPGTRLRVDGIDARVRHRVQMGRHHGLPLTSPGQTFHDLAEDLDLVDLVVVGDSLVRSGLVSRANLERAATQLSGPGTKGAGRAVAYVRPGVAPPWRAA